MSNFLSNFLGAASGAGNSGSRGNLLGGGGKKFGNLLSALSAAANPEEALARLQMEQARLRMEDEATARTEKANTDAAAKNLLTGQSMYTPTDKGPIVWDETRALGDQERKNLLGYIPAARDAAVSTEAQNLLVPQQRDAAAKKLGFAGANDPKFLEYEAAERTKNTYIEGLDPTVVAARQAQTAASYANAAESRAKAASSSGGLQQMKTALEIEAEQRKAQQERQANEARFTQAYQGFTDAIDLAKRIKADPNLKSVVGGFDANTPTMLPGSRAVERDVDTLKSQLALQAIDIARQGSAVGATGFGSMSAPELAIIQNKIAALDLASGAQFEDQLQDVITYMERAKRNLETGRKAAGLPAVTIRDEDRVYLQRQQAPLVSGGTTGGGSGIGAAAGWSARRKG